MKISNETKVGVLAALSITILIVGYNFMKGESILSNNKTYFAVYQEVDGLFRSNPVVINGYAVGQVRSVTMDPETLHLIVSVQIPGEIKVPENSVLKITNNDLLGSKAIEIIMGDSKQLAQTGDTLASAKDAGMAQALTNVLSPLSEKVNSVLSGIDTALTDVSFKSTLADLSEALNSFKNTSIKINALLDGKSEKLDKILNNIDGITRDLKAGTPKINEIILALEETSQHLSEIDMKTLSEEANKAILEIQKTIEAIQNEQGSLGKLVKDDELWNNLTAATKSLDSLAKDIQRYPRRYLGITERQRKKGDAQKEHNEDVVLPKDTK